jgi:hypothetical protein
MLRNRQTALICFFLTLFPLIAFWPITQADFISLDDSKYVTHNFHIQHGISPDAIAWAFTTGYAANWHPLTWMSHMLDIQLFGLNPHFHHVVSLLFHVANTLLLFFVFHRMTKAPWKSAFVAALFALHPLHVQSVAWVAERKDVLSAFFCILTMIAYTYYVERHDGTDPFSRLEAAPTYGERSFRRTDPFSRLEAAPTHGVGSFRSLRVSSGDAKEGFLCLFSDLRYLAVLIFFMLGLMAKPMLVTLPFVLLLLDYWPLQRLEGIGTEAQKATNEKQDPGLAPARLSANNRKAKTRKKPHGQIDAQAVAPCSPSLVSRFSPAVVRSRVREKIPLFIFAALSCVVTFVVQQRGRAVNESFPLGVRVANAVASYVVYIEKTIWPGNLSVLYPHPGMPPGFEVFGSVALLAAMTFIVIWKGGKLQPFAVGWLWFAGALVPVIGIVQVGAQAMADRYTYVPLIGIFIMVSWGIPELLKNWRYRKGALLVMSALVLAVLAVTTRVQVGLWRNSLALYDHAVAVVKPSATLYFLRASANAENGNYRQAIADYDKVFETNPNFPASGLAYYQRGLAYSKLGDHERATADYDKAGRTNSGNEPAHVKHGVFNEEPGNRTKATDDPKAASKLNGEDAKRFLRSHGIEW